MPEPIADRLSRFTPDGAGLDRDALLFAAGRASARPNRRWVALCAALAASQLVTAALLWPRPPAPGRPPVADYRPPEAMPLPSPAPAREGPNLVALRDRALATEGNLPPPQPVESMAPPAPPLRAFGAAALLLPE